MVVGGLDRRQFRCPHRRHQQAYVLHVSRAAGGCRRGAAIDRRGCDGSSTVDMDCRRIRIPLSLFKCLCVLRNFPLDLIRAGSPLAFLAHEVFVLMSEWELPMKMCSKRRFYQGDAQ